MEIKISINGKSEFNQEFPDGSSISRPAIELVIGIKLKGQKGFHIFRDIIMANEKTSERDIANMVGMSLERLSKYIQMQATHGKPSTTMGWNGQKLFNF